MSSLYILSSNPLSDVIYNFILSFNRLPFHFVESFLCCAKAFKFGVVLQVCFGDIQNKFAIEAITVTSKKLRCPSADE